MSTTLNISLIAQALLPPFDEDSHEAELHGETLIGFQHALFDLPPSYEDDDGLITRAAYLDGYNWLSNRKANPNTTPGTPGLAGALGEHFSVILKQISPNLGIACFTTTPDHNTQIYTLVELHPDQSITLDAYDLADLADTEPEEIITNRPDPDDEAILRRLFDALTYKVGDRTI